MASNYSGTWPTFGEARVFEGEIFSRGEKLAKRGSPSILKKRDQDHLEII